MSLKKITAFLLAGILLVPSALLAGEMDKELSALIPKVKQKINVPKNFTEFRSEISSQNKEGKADLYSLSWTDKAYEIGQLSVTAEPDGNIVNYSKYMYKNEYSILAKVSYEEGLKNAKTFLGQIKAPYRNELKLVEETSRMQGNQYAYTFYHYVNGIKVMDQRVMMTVDKKSGEVVNFAGLRTYTGTYGSKEPKVSMEQAKKAFVDKIGIELVYKVYYDYEMKTAKSFPAYVINNGQGKVIDAETGKVISSIREFDIYYGGGLAKEESKQAMNDAAPGLTPQEREVVDEVRGLLSKEKAKSYGEKYFPRLKDAKITSAYLFKSEVDNKYIWRLALQKEEPIQNPEIPDQKMNLMIASGEKVIMPPVISSEISLSIDAKTGEILNYYYYNSSQETKDGVSHAKSKEKVEAFLQKIAKDKYSLTRYDETPEEEMPRPLDIKKPENSSKTYYYTRIANNVPVNGNGLSVTYDAVSDEVVSYSNTWNMLKFKDISKVVSKQEIADTMGLELMYVTKDEKTKVLAYGLTENYISFDPDTAKRITSYDGKPTMQSVQVMYDDIKGHAKEAIIKKLYDSGIYLPGKSFKPDAAINQLDFLRLVLRVSDENITEKDLYGRAVREGIIEEKEKNKDQVITREKAVKYMINGTKYKDIAQIPAIYNYPYKDEKAVKNELKGYVSLAYGLGLIDQNQNSEFSPKAKLTRAEAAQMIYNLLLQEK